MDLSIPIVGLIAFLGYQLNDKKAPRKLNNVRKVISPHENPSGKNMYNSTYSKELQAKERKLAHSNFEKSKNPALTNVIAPGYNSLCTWDCNSTGTPVQSNDTVLPQPVGPAPDRTSQILSGPMFRNSDSRYTQDSAPVTFNKEEFKGDVSKLSGLKYSQKHNNMVPFFGSKVTQNLNPDTNMSILENFTGISELTNGKKEVGNLFKPTKENVYGMQLTNNVSADRFVQSNLKTNLLPVPQIMVQPLPEESVRPFFKGVDDLRNKNNPKITYEQPIIVGKHFISKSAENPTLAKNRPETYYNSGIERTFTGGDLKAPTSRDNAKTIRRALKAQLEESSYNIGPARDSEGGKGRVQLVSEDSAMNEINKLFTMYKEDTNQTFKNDWVRNAKAENNARNTNQVYTYNAVEQERETTNRMTLLPAKDTSKGCRQAMPEDAKPTNKEHNLFDYTGNAVSDVNMPKDYSAEYNSTRDRQWLDNPDYSGIAGNSSHGNYSKTQYDNLNIFNDRECIDDQRNYMSGPSKTSNFTDPSSINVCVNKNLVNTENFEVIQRVRTLPPAQSSMGKQTNCGNPETEHDFSSRVDPDLLSSFKSNPFTKSLHSF